MYDANSEDYERIAGRLLDLLDLAYETAQNPDTVDGFITAADRFFFPTSADHGLASDVVEADALSENLDRHLNRIQNLITEKETTVAATTRIGNAPHIVNLVFSIDARHILGNTAAQRFFGTSFPCSLDALPLESNSKKSIGDMLRAIETGSFEGSKVLKVERVDDPKPYVARCTKIQSRSANGGERRGLTLMINHVDWETDSIDHAASIFELTQAEKDLLVCTLEGKSYQEAAASLGKSHETVRAQAKSILRKSNSAQMSDVIQFMTSYAYLAEPGSAQQIEDSDSAFDPQASYVIRIKSGRKVQVNRFGLKGGRPILFFHGLYQGPYLTPTLDRLFRKNGFDVIAPSRPGFNRTDFPSDLSEFNELVTQDILGVLDHFGWKEMDFVVHHAGISFACRLAKEIGSRAKSAIMIGAGVPIKDYMLKTMNVEARIAGAGVKYAPKVLEMILRVGIAKWRREGAHAYFTNLLKDCPSDLATLNDPEMGPVMKAGIYHMVSGGAKIIIRDGASAMSDWEPDYDFLPRRQLWLHGAMDHVMNVRFVEEFLQSKGQIPPVVYANRGGDVLLAEAQDVVGRIAQFISSEEAVQAPVGAR